MKKYENPEITITMFDTESVLCDSITAVKQAQDALKDAGVTQTFTTKSSSFDIIL